MSDFILLSVPHYAGDDKSTPTWHTCDLSAGESADIFHEWFVGFSHQILFGNVIRDDIDLNRKESRHTQFRKELRAEMKKEPYALVDIHSFPPEISSVYDGAEVAVVTNKKKIEPYIEELAEYLRSHGIESFAVGGQKADICVEAKTHGIPSYLLEFNEHLDNDRLWDIIGTVSDYFIHHVR